MPPHRAPPDALQKRLSRLPNPPPDVITVYMGEKKDSKMSKLKRGLSVEDRAIAERLEKLKKYVPNLKKHKRECFDRLDCETLFY